MSSSRQDLPKESGRPPLGAAFLAAGVTFVVVLAIERSFHPVLLARHRDHVLEECGAAALLVLAFLLAVRSVKKPWN
jgi:hypothetical protein